MKHIRNPWLQAPASTYRLAGALGLIAAAGLTGSAHAAPPALADLSINIGIDAAPPPPRHEVIVERSRPGPDYIWVDGFWDGTPGHYTWVGGHWDRPPHPGARWVGPRWERDHDGHYHQIKGEWRDDRHDDRR